MVTMLSERKTAKLPRLSKSERTRAMLLQVARLVFTERESTASPMDEIALRAQVSRATVYSHFPNRDAMLLALLEADWERQADHYRKLADAPVIDHDVVRKWLMREAAIQRGGNKCLRLYAVLCNQNAEAFERVMQNRDRLIGILGQRFAQFKVGDLRQPEERERRMAAILIMFQIESYCGYCAQAHAVGDVRFGADILAATILQFIGQAEPQA